MLNFNLGISTKRYTHDLSYHINTTSDFGSCQPTLCQFLSPKDKFVMKDFRQLVRNAVMPNPTFGDIKCVNNFRFVPINTIHPAFEAFISGSNIKTDNQTYKPNKIPQITNSLLVAILALHYSKLRFANIDYNSSLGEYTEFEQHFTIKSDLDISADAVLDFLKNPSPSYNGWPSRLSNDVDFDDKVDKKLTPYNSDFFIFDSKQKKVLLIKLTSAGKRLFKIFKGCGYALDAHNHNPISILPLFAFYKAWFDTYAPQRFHSWQNTSCFGLITFIYDKNIIDEFYTSADEDDDTIPAISNLLEFITELSDCWFTFGDDFFNVHQTEPISNVAYDFNLGLNDSSIKLDKDIPGHSDQVKVPNIDVSDKKSISLVQLQTLQRLTRFLNKNSLIGNRIKEYIRVHFGQNYVNSLWEDADNVANFTTDILLDDIYSTSDTSYQSNGEPLGKRGGKGQGFSNENSFSFESSSFGYLIGMCSVHPNSFYFQGDDSQLYLTDRFDFPSPDFDALGWELTPLATIRDSNGIVNLGEDKITDESFGFVPRYSGLKYKKNLVNGDMSLLSKRSSFISFHLDRFIQDKELVSHSPSDFTIFKHVIPPAGPAWKFLSKYPQLGYFNRIFLNSIGLQEDASEIFPQEGAPDDNFTVQCNCNCFVTNQLKPISESYDTFESSTDNDTTTIKDV